MQCKLKLEEYSIMNSINLLPERNSRISRNVTPLAYTVKLTYNGTGRNQIFSVFGRIHLIQVLKVCILEAVTFFRQIQIFVLPMFRLIWVLMCFVVCCFVCHL